METYFSTNASFRVAETDFLASANHKLFFRLVKTYFLTNPSFQLLEDFLFSGNRLPGSFPLADETVTDMSGNHFLKTDLILASGNSFSSWWKPFSSSGLVETHFSVHTEEKVLLFTYSGNHYLNYIEAYLKLLSLPLATIFFDFSDISANVSSFFV